MTEAEIEAAPCPFCGGPAKTLPYNGAMQATCADDYQKCAGTDVLAPIGMWNQRAALAAAEAVRKPDLVPGLERAREIAKETLHAIVSGEHPTWEEPVDDGRGGTVTATDSDVLDRTRSIVVAAITAEIAKATEGEGG